MEAIHLKIGSVRERFASSLNVSWRTVEYWATCRRDELFGAHYDAYSVQSTGPSKAKRENCIEW
jgi:hypothetical protein